MSDDATSCSPNYWTSTTRVEITVSGPPLEPNTSRAWMATYADKLEAAKRWLGPKYLLARPVGRVVAHSYENVPSSLTQTTGDE